MAGSDGMTPNNPYETLGSAYFLACEKDKEIERLRAEVERLKAEADWRSMDSAPRDGTEVFVKSVDGEYFVASWIKAPSWVAREFIWWFGDCYLNDDEVVGWKPTEVQG